MKTAVIVAALTAVVAVTATSSQASGPPPIVFAADRAPSVSGEIYRVDPNGHRVDLSNSPYQDTDPVVSPNGRRVAFVRDLVSKARVFEVGINGGRARAVGPTLPRPADSGCGATLAWQPGTDRLAVGVCGASKGKLWIVQPGKTTLVSQAGLWPSWSPDGRVLIGTIPSPTPGTTLHAYSSTGSPLWRTPDALPWQASWSSTNLLAVPNSTGLAVYTESGHKLSQIRGRVSGGPAWSSDGRFVAVVAGGWLTVKAPTGEGALVFQRLKGNHGLVWNGNEHVVVGGYGSCGCKAKSIDVRTGKWSSASSRWFDPLSPNHKLAILTTPSGKKYAIQVAPTAGGAAKTYTHVPVAYSDGPIPNAWGLQFVDSTRSLVYGSANPEPFSNLYTVSPTGGTPHQIKAVDPYASQPAFSPDGSKIAYSWAPYTGLTCKGCARLIRVANADGTGMQTITSSPSGDCTFDDSPTWSPNGTTILYSESTCENSGELFTVPASGGAPTDLHRAGANPAWGPSKIAYVNNGIWTADPDGSNPTKVSNKGDHPAWSATGTLAYLVGGSTVKAGANTVHLPFDSVSSLSWSPDGTRFVVVARKTKTSFWDVYTVKTDGTNPLRLTKYYGASGATWG